jgi:radical SAM protein with 4Fe4S-binding SPASM domain
MSFYFDPDIPRKSSILDGAIAEDAAAVPLPSLVEISVAGRCNRACSFCPHSDPDYPSVDAFIDPALIEKLTGQLSDMGFKGLVLYSGFGEPLLDKKIFDHIAVTRQNLPDARIELITNGDVLNKKRLLKLFESGLSTLLISVYDGPQDMKKFQALCTRAGLRDDQFVIRPRYLPPEEDFGITLTNRGGSMEHAEHAMETRAVALEQPCYYPHYMMVIDYLGDALLCPHDWGKMNILGSLKTQDFQDIWTSDKLNDVRADLADGNRCDAPCNGCDAKGTLMGEKHVQAWKSYAETSNKR